MSIRIEALTYCNWLEIVANLENQYPLLTGHSSFDNLN